MQGNCPLFVPFVRIFRERGPPEGIAPMSLLDVSLSVDDRPLPRDVRRFLREAERRVEQFTDESHVPAFVPGDYRLAYRTLRALSEAELSPGNLFCEWGSGFGVIACLAAMLEFDACGIEVEG